MSDPVDTNALMDLARAAHNGPDALWEAWEDRVTAALLRGSVLELDRLRAVIENAPHGDDCPDRFDWRDDATLPCTCWKADAL